MVLPLPMRMGSLEEFVDQTRSRIRNADTALLLIDPDLAPFYEPIDGDPPSVLLPDLMPGRGRPRPDDFDAVGDDLDRLAILQFTSGSTSEPKGVMLPQRALCSNLDAIERATSLDVDDDVLVSWLPLYHDMGLVGCLTTPMTTGAGLVLGVAARLPRAPRRVDGVDLDVQGNGHRRSELLVGARHARTASG